MLLLILVQVHIGCGYYGKGDGVINNGRYRT